VTSLIDYRFPRKGAKGTVHPMAISTAAARRSPRSRPRLPVAATAAVLVGALGLLGVLLQAFEKGLGTEGNVPTFILITLNGLTLAGLYFISASGLTLIFGLLRVTNLAHGALFLLGGYVALSCVQDAGLPWWLAAVVAMGTSGLVGLVVHQLFLRWNQGQDLRQALITIAVSIILADQMLAHFGGIAEGITWPGRIDHFVNLHVEGVQYSEERLLILALALVIGAALWLWLQKTRTGMVIRAGVDDRAMVSALGINIQRTFAVAFLVGSALAGLGGVVGGSFASLAPGVDSNWLLNSLVVVIIGGMGSLGGAAIGSLLLGLTTNLSAAYLPQEYNYYSIVLTFVLLAIVLAVRPLGIYGRPA
jgi:branched-chain amino acid transport system permease protein